MMKANEERAWVEFAEELGIQLHIAAGNVFVKSSKGNWWIELKKSGVRLWHGNFVMYMREHSSFKANYHVQRDYMENVMEALLYIVAHDRIRYTNCEKTERKFLALQPQCA